MLKKLQNVKNLLLKQKILQLNKNKILGSGNGVRKNKALIKAFEDRFGAEMKVPVHMEEAAFGAALFGLISCGIFENAKEAQKIIKYSEGGLL